MPDDREARGRLVHQVRRDFADAHGQKFLLKPWEERHPEQQELDNRIAETIEQVVTAAVRGRFGHALREHYLAGITCDRARHEDNPVCACSRVFLGWHPSVGAAVDAWIGHVMEAAGGEHEAAPDPETPLSEALHTLGQVRHMAGSMVMSENLTTRDCGRRILAALGDEPEEERNDEKG